MSVFFLSIDAVDHHRQNDLRRNVFETETRTGRCRCEETERTDGHTAHCTNHLISQPGPSFFFKKKQGRRREGKKHLLAFSSAPEEDPSVFGRKATHIQSARTTRRSLSEFLSESQFLEAFGEKRKARKETRASIPGEPSALPALERRRALSLKTM